MILSALYVLSPLSAAETWQPIHSAEKLLCPPVKKKEPAQVAQLRKAVRKIEEGGDINAVDKDKRTALIQAVQQGNRLVACWLIAKGAKVTLKDKDGKTAFDYAKSSALRRLLLACEREKKPLTQQEKMVSEIGSSTTPEEMHRKFLRNAWHFPHMEALIKTKADTTPSFDLYPKVEPIMTDSRMRAETLAYLVRHGCDVNAHTRTADGRLACSEYTTSEVCRMLLACGMQADPQRDDPAELFWLALLSDDTAGVKCLAQEHPALVNMETENRGWPLSNASSVQMVKVLIAAGADPKKQKEKDGRYATVLDYAACYSYDDSHIPVASVLRELIKAGAKPTPDNNCLVNSRWVAAGLGLLGKDAPENEELKNGGGLTIALLDRRLPIVKKLLEAGMYEKDDSFYISRALSIDDGDCAPYFLDSYVDRYVDVPKIIRLLLNAGIKPDEYQWKKLFEGVPNIDECTPSPVREAYMETLRLMINSGNPIPTDALSQLNRSRNMSAAEYSQAVAMLLDAGVDIKAHAADGITPLFHAGADAATFKKFMDAGVDPLAKSAKGETALFGVQTAELAELLIQKSIDVNAITCLRRVDDPKGGVPALCFILAWEGSEKLSIVKALVNAGAKAHGHNGEEEWDAFSYLPANTSFKENKELVELLKQAGGNPNYAWEGHYMENSKLSTERVKVSTERLLNAGADANYTFAPSGMTPLMLRPYDAKALLRAGANANARDKNGLTPLMYAAKAYSPGAISDLLRAGADVNAQDNEGMTALHYAIRDELCTKELLKASPNLNIKDNKGRTPLDLARKENPEIAKIFIEATPDAVKAVMDAENINSPELLRAALKNGMDPNMGNAAGKTPLMRTTNEECVRLLIEAKADVNATDREGSTALLLLTIACDNAKAAELLLNAGADATKQNRWKRSPLMLAIEHKRTDIRKLLEARGVKE